IIAINKQHTETYTLSLHDALPIYQSGIGQQGGARAAAEIPADEEVPVTVHDKYRHAGLRQGEQGSADLVGQRVGVVVPQPDLERSEEHTSELQSRENLVCRLLLEK